MTLVREVMSQSVSLLAPSDTISKAAKMMRDEKIGSLPVAEDDKLVGMLTDRDIVIQSVAAGEIPDSTPVAGAMSEGILYCFDDQNCDDIAENMGKNQVQRLPVVDRVKRLVGIVSLGDLWTEADPDPAEEALKDIKNN